MIMAPREDIAEQLWLRDEHELARQMLDTDDSTYQQVMVLAAHPDTGGRFRDRVDELLVAAAIEVLSGERRRPARWRPRPESAAAALWQEVGPDRDHRDSYDVGIEISKLLDGM